MVVIIPRNRGPRETPELNQGDRRETRGIRAGRKAGRIQQQASYRYHRNAVQELISVSVVIGQKAELRHIRVYIYLYVTVRYDK
jgi:hypothetical protein